MDFGQLVKSHRVKLGVSLRQFCMQTGFDAAYVSRIENNLIPAPESADKLKGLARSLRISIDTEEWVDFFDLAAISRREIPADISIESREARDLLPVFYRTLRKRSISKGEAELLLRLIKGQPSDNE